MLHSSCPLTTQSAADLQVTFTHSHTYSHTNDTAVWSNSWFSILLKDTLRYVAGGTGNQKADLLMISELNHIK